MGAVKLGLIPESLLERVALWSGRVPAPALETMLAMFGVRTLMVGTKLGVFEALREGPRTPEQVAPAIGGDPRATAKLLSGLTGLGYLEHRDGAFALAPVARRWMLGDSPGSQRDSVLFRFLEWDLLGRYEEFVRTGRPLQIHGSDEFGREGWALYQRGMRSLSGLSAEEIARRTPTPPDPTALLDIGGSHGFNSVCFCRRHPNLRATILDLPEAVEHAASILAEEGMGDRVVHRPGNALEDDLGESAWDIVFVAQLVHHFGDAANRELAARIARALKPGGTFAVVEIERPVEPGGGGQLGALMDLYFALTSESGTWSVAEIQAWQRDAGLEILRPIRMRTAPGVLQVARKV